MNTIPPLHWVRSAIRGYVALIPDGFYGVTPEGGDWKATWFPRYGAKQELGTWPDKAEAMARVSDHLGDS